MFKHNRFKNRSTYHRLLLYLVWVTLALASPFKAMHQKSQVGGGGEIIAHRRVVADTSKVTNLTRQHNGDVFFSVGEYLTPSTWFFWGQSVGEIYNEENINNNISYSSNLYLLIHVCSFFFFFFFLFVLLPLYFPFYLQTHVLKRYTIKMR